MSGRRRHKKLKHDVLLNEAENTKLKQKSTILTLNDDCLLTIFSYIQLQDLCSIAVTCLRINNIASQLYKRYRILDAEAFLRRNQHTLTTDLKIERIIKQIGNQVKSFRVSNKILNDNGIARTNALIKCVLQHCCIIRELKIDFVLDDEFLNILLEMENFQKLETFDLSCSASDAGKKLLNLKNLKYFNIYLKFK